MGLTKEDKKSLKKYGVVPTLVKCHICNDAGGTLVKDGPNQYAHPKCKS